MINFDKTAIDILRRECYKVYIDIETKTEYNGSLTGYTGDRIRIYITSWDYEDPEIIRTNDELKKCTKECISDFYDGIEDFIPEMYLNYLASI